jgi:hypothetical protein
MDYANLENKVVKPKKRVAEVRRECYQKRNWGHNLLL